MQLNVDNLIQSSVWQRIKKADLASRIKTNWDKQLGFPTMSSVSGTVINGTKRSFWQPEVNIRTVQKAMYKLVENGLEATMIWMEQLEMPEHIQYMIRTLYNV